MAVETYVMKNIQEDGAEVSKEDERTLIVKRMDLIFNDKDCQVLNFSDITSYKQLS